MHSALKGSKWSPADYVCDWPKTSIHAGHVGLSLSLRIPTVYLWLGAGVSNWRPSSCCKTTSPIMPLPLGVMLVTVNLAMPHGT
ncbi:unnamed protein product [Staurois parvus]|uniref:Uncharacterized protein n=1 Tax=Staurois parvus TaxID=386267 RepID=A0ABN9BHQ7_9NEOB|nr:unnamed protein product [Staurois parvus]